MSRSVVALSSAAVLAIYSAGYLRTQAAADRFAAEADQRRPSIPAPAETTASSGPDVAGVSESGPGQAPGAIAPADPGTTDARKPAVQPDEAGRERPTSAAPAATPATRLAVDADKAPANVVTTPVVRAEPDAPAALAATVAAVQAATPAAAGTTPTAPATPDTPAAAPAAPKYKDGTYTGWGTSRHGDIQAQVVIVDGRITSATIAQCMTRWPCSWIEALPPQVVQRQSAETDFVSGATQSTNAFYYGVVQALGKAALP